MQKYTIAPLGSLGNATIIKAYTFAEIIKIYRECKDKNMNIIRVKNWEYQNRECWYSSGSDSLHGFISSDWMQFVKDSRGRYITL